MFFHSLSDLGRVLVVGMCAYAGLVLVLRISGKRTLSKMNAFDFVVTIALGSTLATVLLSKDIALAEGLFAFAWLAAMQWIVAWLAVRFPAWRKLIKSNPRLLVLRGEMLEAALLAERISPGEIHAALRTSGHASLAEVEAVVLEADGSFSVIASSADRREATALRGLSGFVEQERRA